VPLFHHAHGQTPGVLALADDLRAAGRTVHAPDLYSIAGALVAATPTAELFLYPGSAHLFADPSLADQDEAAAVLLDERTLAFLHRVG
jgi:dienelactone hydrolase